MTTPIAAPARPARDRIVESTGDGSVHDLAGTNPEGGALAIVLKGRPERTLLAFLTSGCNTCQGFWDAFRSDADLPRSVDRLVVNRVPAPLAEGALGEVYNLASASGPEAEAARRLAGILQSRTVLHREVLAALDATVRDPKGRGDKGLTLLPLVAREPRAELVADWLLSEEAA